MMNDEQLGRLAYEEFQHQIGVDGGRMAWNGLNLVVRGTWASVARVVVEAVREDERRQRAASLVEAPPKTVAISEK